MTRAIKWLIFTNLYIGIAAICFQGVIYYLHFEEDWSWVLTAHTFFATCLVYQFSRWNFHKNYVVSEEAQNDEIYQFVDNHKIGVRNSIIVSTIGTIITSFFLSTNTLLFLGFLGLISILYSFRIKEFSLRALPYLKIFLIAFVWASIAVWMPFFQIKPDYVMADYLLYFAFCVLYILFITLPFDKSDLTIDQLTGVKTIPALLGEKMINALLIVLAIVLCVMAYLLFQNVLTICLFTLLIIVLLLISIFIVNRIDKWLVMAIYDGSMILFYLIISLFSGF